MLRFSRIVKNWSFYIRSCAICHLSIPPVQWLCSYCWQRLSSYHLSPQEMIRKQNKLIHARLINWNKENDIFIRSFLNSLKNGGPIFIFHKIMESFAHRMIFRLHGHDHFVIVPAPPKHHFPKDHAFCLSLALSRICQFPVYSVLRRASSQASSCHSQISSSNSSSDDHQDQKYKNKYHRKNIYFQKTRELPPESKVIFVDDILTTGATAYAAYVALGKPKSFQIFTLAWRQNIHPH